MRIFRIIKRTKEELALTKINDERLAAAGPEIQKVYFTNVVQPRTRFKTENYAYRRKVSFWGAVGEMVPYVLVGYVIGFIGMWTLIITFLFKLLKG